MRKLRSVLGHLSVLFEQKTAINSRLLRLRKIFALILVKQLKISFHVLLTKTNLKNLSIWKLVLHASRVNLSMLLR